MSFLPHPDHLNKGDVIIVNPESMSAFKGECGFVFVKDAEGAVVRFVQDVHVPYKLMLRPEKFLEDQNKPYEVITAYAAFTTDDDRGSLGSCLGYFSTEKKAKSAATGHGYYGGDGRVVTRDLLHIKLTDEYFVLDHSAHDYGPVEIDENFEDKLKAVREAALAKLTDHEIEALGLKKD